MTEYLKHQNDFNNPELASVFDELSFWSARFGILLFDQLQLRPRQNILDVGFGNGFPLFELAHRAGRTSSVTGIEIWREAIKRARRKLKIHALPNAHLVEADAAHQPFGSETFDLIVSNLGINNFSDPAAALKECFRVGRPSARIALTTNLQGHYAEFYEVFREVLKDADKEKELERLAEQEAHRGTKSSVCELLEEAGFDIARVVEESFQMRFTDGSALLNHSLTRYGFLGGWRSVLQPGDELEVFARIEARLNELARSQGELRMTVPMLYVEGSRGS